MSDRIFFLFTLKTKLLYLIRIVNIKRGLHKHLFSLNTQPLCDNLLTIQLVLWLVSDYSWSSAESDKLQSMEEAQWFGRQCLWFLHHERQACFHRLFWFLVHAMLEAYPYIKTLYEEFGGKIEFITIMAYDEKVDTAREIEDVKLLCWWSKSLSACSSYSY